MAADDFFNRWSRKNAEARAAREQSDATQAAAALPDRAEAPPDPFEGRMPTLEDVDRVTPDADFSPFMKQGVDQAVKRAALKKLFADPRFNVMDGLDVYIDDFTKSDPIPPEMMAMLNHAKDLLNPPATRGGTLMKMLDAEPEPPVGQSRAEGSEETADTRHEAEAAAANDENEQAANEEAAAAAGTQAADADDKGQGSGVAATDDAGAASGRQMPARPPSPAAQPATPVPPTGEETPLP